MLAFWHFKKKAQLVAPALVLHTPRLRLRLIRIQDARHFSQYAGDPKVARWMFSFPSPYPYRRARARIRDMVREYRAGHALPMVVETRQNHQFIGVAVMFHDEDKHKGELAYWIAQPFWHRGYGREAVSALMDHATHLGIENLYAMVIAGNHASARLLKSLGFRLKDKHNRQDSSGRNVILLHYQAYVGTRKKNLFSSQS